MKLNKNIVTLLIIIVAVVAIYVITRSDIFQMKYYENVHAGSAGQQF